MTALLGILGAAALFALMGYAATRVGSRLGDAGGCQGDSCDLDSCSLHGSCEGSREEKSPAGWWPEEGVTYGDRR
jgi:hypothetical protein